MKKILSVIALIAAVSMLIVACSVEPEDNVWVQDKDLPTSGSDIFTINFEGVAIGGAAYTGNMQVFGNITDAAWGTHPIVAVVSGAGQYTNAGIAKGTAWKIAACFTGSDPAAGWAAGTKLDNSQGGSDWSGTFNGYQYSWDMSLTVGPEQMDALATVAK